MAQSAQCFVSIPDLQRKVGTRIAELLNVPAAMVTSGAASAITIATAACLARADPHALGRLPDTTGLNNEVIVQTAHQDSYEPQIRFTGARVRTVDTRADLDHTIGLKTAMMFFTNWKEPLGQIQRDEWLQVARFHGIPTLNDAAADVPPVGRFREYHEQGFDLVAFSGGKAIRGPQSSGILLGNADLIAIAQQAISPNMGLGRSMKVGKEEIVGLLVALERFLEIDHAAQMALWQSWADEIASTLAELPRVKVQIIVPALANHSPHVILDWSQRSPALASHDLVSRLRAGDPPIAVLTEASHSLRIAVWTLQEHEHQQVAHALRQALE
jgi:L-seryl-tRNA(Ser) seleniumtransferase